MLNEIKCQLMFWKIKARLSRLKKRPELYWSVSNELTNAYTTATTPCNKEMYSRLVEYWKRQMERCVDNGEMGKS